MAAPVPAYTLTAIPRPVPYKSNSCVVSVGDTSLLSRQCSRVLCTEYFSRRQLQQRSYLKMQRCFSLVLIVKNGAHLLLVTWKVGAIKRKQTSKIRELSGITRIFLCVGYPKIPLFGVLCRWNSKWSSCWSIFLVGEAEGCFLSHI